MVQHRLLDSHARKIAKNNRENTMGGAEKAVFRFGKRIAVPAARIPPGWWGPGRNVRFSVEMAQGLQSFLKSRFCS
jgi:hypothetical protein